VSGQVVTEKNFWLFPLQCFDMADKNLFKGSLYFFYWYNEMVIIPIKYDMVPGGTVPYVYDTGTVPTVPAISYGTSSISLILVGNVKGPLPL
jgi:hypothetical protein